MTLGFLITGDRSWAVLHGSHPDAKRPFSVLNASVLVLITSGNLRDGTAQKSSVKLEMDES